MYGVDNRIVATVTNDWMRVLLIHDPLAKSYSEKGQETIIGTAES